MSAELFSLQGKIYTAVRDAVTGKPGLLQTWLGNVSNASIALTTDKSDKFESFSGNRLLYGSLQKSKSATLTMTLDEWLPSSLLLALYGTNTAITGTTVTNEVFPSGLVVGNQVRLAHQFVSSVVVHDSTGSPLTLTPGTDYVIDSVTQGLIRIVNLGSYVQPFKANYTYASASLLTMFTVAKPPERYVIFDGVNTNTGEPIIAELYRAQFDPAKELGLIDADWGSFDMSATCLYDSINAIDATLGGFGRLITGPAP